MVAGANPETAGDPEHQNADAERPPTEIEQGGHCADVKQQQDNRDRPIDLIMAPSWQCIVFHISSVSSGGLNRKATNFLPYYRLLEILLFQLAVVAVS